MELTIFQSDKGDCILLKAKSGEHVLCDGGMASSMKAHVRAELAKLKSLDYVYISHFDSDHISGVLQLLQDEVAWRVYDHHRETGGRAREPDAPRPPRIDGILHNSFRDQIGVNQADVENLLASAVPALFASYVPELTAAAAQLEEVATSIPEAIKVSRLIAPGALNIPLNQPPGAAGPAKLLMAGQSTDHFELGSMQFTLIGPSPDQLNSLKDGWVEWLRNNKEQVRKIRAALKKRVDSFASGALKNSPLDLRDWNGVPDYEGVTPPNVASLMYLVEEDGKTLLLTGDAHHDHIIQGLERAEYLEKNKGVHLNVLKVQHHGSEHNLDADFARRVSADHYVFCGDGKHGNPELSVIDLIAESRLGDDPNARALAAPAGRDFHFWFSTASTALPQGSAHRETFKQVERHVVELVRRSNNRLKVHFNDQASHVLKV